MTGTFARLTRRAVLATVLAAATGTPLAHAGTGGPDAFGYTWADNASGCSNANLPFGPSARTFSGVTDMLGPFALGWSLPFYGRAVDQVWVSPKGYLAFSAEPSTGVTQQMPDAAAPNNLIAAFWTDSASANITTEVTATQFHVYWQMSVGAATIDRHLYLNRDGGWRMVFNGGFLLDGAVGYENDTGTEGLTLYRRFGGVQTDRDGSFPLPSGNTSACITAPDLLDCGSPTPLTCDEVTVVNLPGGDVTPASVYGCTATEYPARERLVELVLDEPVAVEISLDRNVFDLMWIDSDDCAERQCLQLADPLTDTLTFDVLFPGTYYFVIDAENEFAAGPVGVDVTCSSIGESISCEEALVGDTTGGFNVASTYPCVMGDYSGSESYYFVDFVGPGNLNVSLDSTLGHAVAIFDGTQPLDPVDCLAGGVGGAVLYDPPDGRYLIVVDSQPGMEGEYTIELSCAPEIDCVPGAGVINCNDPVPAGDTTGLPSLVDFYRCSGIRYDGPEAVYRFTVTEEQVVSFVLDDSAVPELDLILLRDCNEGACTDIAENELSEQLTPGDYVLVVDGRDGAAGPYQLDIICGSSIEPDFISINGAAGECFTEEKTVWLTPDIPKADVLFAIDLTGSMGAERAQLQANMTEIINRLQTFISDVAYGLVSYRDYSASGSGTIPCSYNASSYGSPGDYPYRLEQPITTDQVAITNAVNALPGVSGGNDGPESYSRVIFEAYSDAAIAWRPGARRMLVNFGDELPHDCNVLECLGGVASTRGIDLGRDNLPDSGDELAILDVIQGLDDARTTLLHLESSGGGSAGGGFTYRDVWDCWAAMTGGRAVQLNSDGTVPGGIDLVELVGELISEQGAFCSTLELAAEPGFEEWLVSASPIYLDERLPTVQTFDIEICVPDGTPEGTYRFEVQVLCSGGVVVAQQVEVIVSEDCRPAVVTTPTDETICIGDSQTLDASGMGLVNCPGGPEYEWTDDSGATVGTTAIIDVSPDVTTTYTVEVSCASDPTCSVSEEATVTVEAPPIFDQARGADIADCNVGIRLTWEAATFLDPTRSGVYNVYRSEISCANALTRAPVVEGLTELTWIDTGTRDGRSYFYVVEAEDARSPTVCTPQGPFNGGAVTRVCIGDPILEEADEVFPAGVNATLRMSHVGHEVTASWSMARSLLTSETYRLLKAVNTPEGTFNLVNGTSDTSRVHTETDTSSPLQFFDLRVANGCNELSEDEYPPGFDTGRGL